MRALVWLERGATVASAVMLSAVVTVAPASAAPGSLLVASASNQAANTVGETFATYTFSASEPVGKDTVLSSTPDGLTPMAVDDAIDVKVKHPDNTVSNYTYDFGGGCSGTITPSLIDLTPLMATGANTVQLTLRDVCGARDGNTDIWVVGGGTYSAGSVAPSRQYVSMGDSYASGEGNPPFDSGTDIKGGNTCHRSQRAFGPLLAKDLGVTDARYVACSGATTGNIVVGTTPPTNSPESTRSDPEAPQVSVLSSSTRLVTIMVGGDDLDFEGVLIDCVIFACPVAARLRGSAVHDLDRKLDALQPVLTATYTAIKKAAPNAVVYVLGYPNLVPPNPSVRQDLGGTCAGDSGLVLGSLSFLAKRQTRLQNIVRAAAQSAGVNFVDPNAPGKSYSFVGHDICAAKSWFIRVANRHVTSASFHPTTTGQQKLEQAVLDNGVRNVLTLATS